jgi:hypothetical protein
MQEIDRSQGINAVPASVTFAAAFLGLMAIGALLMGSFPLQASIISVFLFAGAHNFMEFRYFLARMPVRWGRSRLYYSVGIGGVVILTVSYLTIYFSSGWLWNPDTSLIVSASWNTAFILWVGSLFYLRGRQKPRSDWTLAFAVAFLLAALAWLIPAYWSLALIYIHPFIAMWFFERQLRRSKPEWLRAYHLCLATIPFFVVALYFAFASAPALPEDTQLFWRIAQHSGSEILPGLSSHFLVAVHVFLETIHYFVWILLIPLIDPRAIPWRLKEIPLIASEKGFPKIFVSLVIVSLVFVIAFWAGFAVDYTVTRDIYFALAIGHVLAEFPFLVKML